MIIIELVDGLILLVSASKAGEGLNALFLAGGITGNYAIVKAVIPNNASFTAYALVPMLFIVKVKRVVAVRVICLKLCYLLILLVKTEGAGVDFDTLTGGGGIKSNYTLVKAVLTLTCDFVTATLEPMVVLVAEILIRILVSMRIATGEENRDE